MTCYHPISAWRSRSGRSENGKWPLVFSVKDGYSDYRVLVPCHQCIGCRKDYMLGWCIRLMHELSFYKDAMFVTFTYRDEPDQLYYQDFQKFFKRLRKHLFQQTGTRPDLKYYVSGEYGDHYGRPHFHAIIFGLWPVDSFLFSNTSGGNFLYVSPLLERLWSHGFVKFSPVTAETCSYVAGYVRKKMTGAAVSVYVDPETGELRKPPFSHCSQGIGKRWIEKYWRDITNCGYLVYKGHRCPVPAYYENYIEQNHYEDYLTYLSKRSKLLADREKSFDNHPDRLADREAAVNYRLDRLLPRKLDSSD